MFSHKVAYILTFHLYRHEDTFALRVRGKTLCIMPSSTTECGKLEPISGIARGELRST